MIEDLSKVRSIGETDSHGAARLGMTDVSRGETQRSGFDAKTTGSGASELSSQCVSTGEEARRYGACPEERTPEIIGAEIRALTASMLSSVIEIGRRMCEVKELLPYGSFGEWVKTETGYSASTANNFMRVYREYGGQTSLFGSEAESQTLGKLSYTKALALLAVPAQEREDFAAEVDAEHLSTRELEKAIRERDEARRDLQTTASRLEDSQRTISEMGKQNTELRAKLTSAREDLQEADEQAEANERELRQRIAELESRPVEVAVQEPDPAQLEAAVAAALEKAKAESKAETDKLSEALKAREAETEKLKAKLKAAEAAEAEAKETAKKAAGSAAAAAEERLRSAEAEAERLRKELAMADPVTAEFKGVFEQAAALVPKLRALADQAPEDKKDKLRAAMSALGKQLIGEQE